MMRTNSVAPLSRVVVSLSHWTALVSVVQWSVLVSVFHWTAATKVGFIKDQSMDAVFPGPVYQQDKSLPVGHMRPLGWQRETDGPVKELEEMPATREFYEKFVAKNLPVVFRNGVKDAPAFDTWADDQYLSTKYGQQNVSVRLRIAKRRDMIVSEEKVMTFKKFLFDYMYDELYLASDIPQGLMEELPLPKCVRCGTLAEQLLSSQLWMSSGGTSSRVHSHDDHLVHCVLFGRRDFIIIKEVHRRSFQYIEDYPESLGGHSDMDTNIVNLFRFKNIPKVPWRWSTLYPGDCIYVPAGYLHQVRSYGRSISVTLEFAPLDRFDDTGCVLVEEEFVPLSDAIYLLTFENGQLRLTDTDMGVEEVRNLLLILVGKKEALTQDRFTHFYNMVLGEEVGILPASEVFGFMSLEDESQLTRADLTKMPTKRLKNVAKAFNQGYANKVKAQEAKARAKIPRSRFYRGPKEDL